MPNIPRTRKCKRKKHPSFNMLRECTAHTEGMEEIGATFLHTYYIAYPKFRTNE
jgi:hypothetical protein